MNKIIIKLLLVASFVSFLYSVFQAADCFYNKEYICWFLFLNSSILSYCSYKHFINSLDEEDYYS